MTRPAPRPLSDKRWNEGRGAGASLPPVLAALTITAALLPAGAPAKSLHPDYQLLRGEVQQYGDWLVGCDNTASCTMLGLSRPVEAIDHDGPSVADMAIRISYSGADGTAPAVDLLPMRQVAQAAPASRRFRLSGGGRPLKPFYRYAVTRLDQPTADLVVFALEKGLKLAGFDLQGNVIVVRFPADQFRRAHRAMQSRRDSLLKQLSNQALDNLPGELPDGTAMPTPGPHIRIPARPVIVSGYVPIFTAMTCSAGTAQNLLAYRFDSGAMLWRYDCGVRTDAARSYWQMAPDSLSKAELLDLPEPRHGKVQAGAQGLENAEFDFDFGVLRAYTYHLGREDCGILRVWAHTQQGWQLLERREMSVCLGLKPKHWIRTHFTPTSGPVPDA